MKKEMGKSKTDSYLKFVLWMVIGGAFGMVAGIVFVMTGRNVEALVKGAEVWMSRYASWILVMLFAVTIVCGFYQVAAVKQIRRKEPMKQGDAADFDFEKQWLASCDEGEKRVLYEAGYRAYAFVKIILLAAVVVALLGEVFLGIGLSAVVLLTVCNVISAVIYSYYCRKLEKGRLD